MRFAARSCPAAAAELVGGEADFCFEQAGKGAEVLVAGSYVQEGKITRNSKIRVVRDGIVITEDEIASLRRFKDDVKEVAQGHECGVTLEKFSDIKEGDIFEAFILEEYRD